MERDYEVLEYIYMNGYSDVFTVILNDVSYLTHQWLMFCDNETPEIFESIKILWFCFVLKLDPYFVIGICQDLSHKVRNIFSHFYLSLTTQGIRGKRSNASNNIHDKIVRCYLWFCKSAISILSEMRLNDSVQHKIF